MKCDYAAGTCLVGKACPFYKNGDFPYCPPFLDPNFKVGDEIPPYPDEDGNIPSVFSVRETKLRSS